MSEEANSTGIVLDWEKQAMRGDPMPDGLDYPEQVLYQAMTHLYARCNLNKRYPGTGITRDQARVDKLKLLDEYRVYKHHWQMGEEWVEIIKLTELARAEFRKNPTVENGWKLIQIIEGRKK